jgi:hypothetical protein
MSLQPSWDQFQKYIDRARELQGDQWVPVALILVQARIAPDDRTELFLEENSITIWPGDFPLAERAEFMKRLASMYDKDGGVVSQENA